MLSQRIKCAESKSWCLGMLRECLVYSSMRLGVPFIAPRQLGAVGAPDTVRCTPDSPVPPTRRWLGHVSHADRAADRWLTGQSDAPPDSPVIYSRTPSSRPESSQLTRRQPGAPDTVRCTIGQSDLPRLSRVLAARAKSFPIVFSLILALRQIC